VRHTIPGCAISRSLLLSPGEQASEEARPAQLVVVQGERLSWCRAYSCFVLVSGTRGPAAPADVDGRGPNGLPSEGVQ
jgi:hypothetical protein